MHEFKYRDNILYCEDVRVADIAKKVGTPFYLYSYQTIVDHFRKLKDAFREIDPLICFSMKSNANLAVCKALLNEGAGLDIVSGGELYRAIKAGADPKKIVYASVGKKKEEIREAIRRGIFMFNVESVAELALINRIAGNMSKKIDVAIRVNPDVKPKTHKHITTGTKETKFGIALSVVENIFDNSNRYRHLNLIGLHIHIGSQITEAAPYIKAIKKVISFIKDARIDVKSLNIGGGLGIIYSKEKPQTAKEFANAILPLFKGSGLRIILEPGRFIIGNSGILVTSVLYVKKTQSKKFVIVDAGMNDLIRPSFYEAYHEIAPVTRRPGAAMDNIDVVGPICESGDFLAKDRRFQEVRPGDILAVMSAGAYGFSMASNYNARPRPCEVMVINGRFYIIRRRERYEDLIRGESIPKALK
ncbi:MAG: diaminopimelate decarboxylase [Candidatus Omnitrophica bacterium]|nr:diaminopimelate decarboxylase [Candidatus Omnitrophota bacterium]MBU4488921.1 diaminopimelate decarboxylase [Candidatus Omnitrophota bacterium]MCG2705317.1 diaminopimelate decarboxylase [Candidatus Omnitrophota bacterium]